MKKVISIVAIVFLTGACAGMDQQYQRNMATNAAGYGVAGAVVGAGIAAATHGNIGRGAAIGAGTGALLGAAGTPPPRYQVAQAYGQPPTSTNPPVVVYDQPPEVIYVEPPPVYYAPPPVYYAQPPVYYGNSWGGYYGGRYYGDYWGGYYGGRGYYDGHRGGYYGGHGGGNRGGYNRGNHGGGRGGGSHGGGRGRR